MIYCESPLLSWKKFLHNVFKTLHGIKISFDFCLKFKQKEERSDRNFVTNSMLLTTSGKIKDAKNHRQINAWGEAEDIEPVIYGIPYFLPRSVYYFSSYLLRKVSFL